jgi:pantoate--beta-alanine ligase
MTSPTRQTKARLRTARTVAELRSLTAAARAGGARIGLVPTMGALHEGHLSLIRRAREQCELVVVSVFVNPAQFDEQADLARYPRRESEDAALAAAAGADVLFAPAPAEVYPAGFATSVEVQGISDRLEGEVRGPGHFRGVSTVVTKLLCMAGPDVAYFGQKDAQQLVVIRRLVADLNLPVRIEGLPTVREPDGLAMSSRNARLSPAERERAVALPAALQAARVLVAGGTRDAAEIAAAAVEAMRARGVEPQYAAVVDPESFEPLTRVESEVVLALAARVGDVRLIDNTILTATPAPQSRQYDKGGAITPCSA